LSWQIALRGVGGRARAYPGANESFGKHLAFDRNNWLAGLKHLAKAKNSQLRAVAAADQSAASDSAQMAKTGDLWWSLAEGADDARDKAG
jgi:hypothetical protein